MTIAPFDAEVFAVDLSDLAHAMFAAPLTGIIAWHTETGTSQQRALQAIQDYKTVIVSGGNRSGKTFLLRSALVALTLGSDHPHARQFWLNNGCDPDAFPTGPGEAYIIALTSNDSLRYHRKDVAALLPEHGRSVQQGGCCRWWNKNGRGEARVEVDVPGYDQPAVIWFKSEDQGEEGIQGDAVRAILHDEEGDTDRVWEEAGVRLIDFDGWQLMANTPLKGRTWVWEKYVKETPPDVAYVEIWTEHNPFLPLGAVEKLRKKNKAAARLRGQWVVAEGMVYGASEGRDGWIRDRHVCTRAMWARLHPSVTWTGRTPEIPADWPRFRVQDFGFTNPGAVLWLVYDPDGRVFLYRSIHRAEWHSRMWAEAIVRAEGGDPSPADPSDWVPGTERIERTWADPAAAEQIRTLRQEYGVRYRLAAKDWAPGRDACAEALELRADGWPGFMVIDGAAPEFVTEVEGYRYPEGEHALRNATEKPVKKNDHALDAWRYGMLGIRRWAR